MKANESVKNYPSTRRAYANYAARGVKKICRETGPRFAGTEAEQKGLEYMAKELESCCDEVYTDSFSVGPRAFLSGLPFAAALASLSSAAFFAGRFFESVVPFCVSLVLAAAAALFAASQFLFSWEPLSLLFPKKTSHNVYGVIRASGETRGRIIFSGRVDSPAERRLLRLGGPGFSAAATGGSVLGIVFVAAADAAVLIGAGAGRPAVSPKALAVLSYISLAFIVFFFAASFFYGKPRAADGALSGCFVAAAVSKFMRDNGVRFENVEVAVLCAGAGEIGSRGAKAFCKARGGELSGVETVFVGLGAARDAERAAIYVKDPARAGKNDPAAVRLVRESAKIAGYDLPYKTAPFGASDAAAVGGSGTGIKAVSLAADDAPRGRRARSGESDASDLKAIEALVGVCLETAFLYDEKGLDV